MKTITGTFQKADGGAVALGKLYLRLSQDATAVATAQIAPQRLGFALDANGTLGAGVQVLGNDELMPAGTTYTLEVRDLNDVLMFGPEPVSITGTSPINLNLSVLASPGATPGVLLLTVTSITTKNLNGISFLEGYGAKCDGVTDDSVALAAAIADAVANHWELRLPPGKTCAFGTSVVINAGYFGITGGAGSVLKYTGAGEAILIDGSGVGNGAGNVLLRGFAINAPSGTCGLHTKKLTRSHLSDLECRGASGAAFIFDFAVSNQIDNLTVSVNNGAFSATPVNGLLLDNLVSNASSNNTFTNTKIEGVSGDGIVVQGANANTFIGGTSEGNGGRGLYVSGTAQNNTFIGMDIESNVGYDIEMASATNRGTQFINMTVQHDLYINGAPKETVVIGGQYTTITILAGAVATTLVNVRYTSLADAGTATNLIGQNGSPSNILAGIAVSGGGALSGTFTGTHTYSGAVTFGGSVALGSGATGTQIGASQFFYAPSFLSNQANPASAGLIRACSNEGWNFRNFANSADVIGLKKSTSDVVQVGDTAGVLLGGALTGTPTAPTAAADTDTTQLATTAYVVGQGYAKLTGPTFTGVPAAPTAAVDTNTTQLATTAFVVGQTYAKLASPTFTGQITTPRVQTSVSALPATTGTVSLDASLGSVFTVTPTGAITLNATNCVSGQQITLIVTTSGASSFNITFNTNFKATAVLATGTTGGKVFTVTFVCNGATATEIARTVAM